MKTLYDAFSKIEGGKEFDAFLADLCTPAEIKALEERWNIAQFLSAGLSQRAAAERTGAAIATVTRVARFLNGEPFGGYRAVLSRLHLHA